MPSEILVYCTKFCPYCLRTHILFKRKGIKYTTVDIGGDDALRKEMEEKSGRTSVPQIFIGNHHVGGFDDLSAHSRSGQLDELLKSL